MMNDLEIWLERLTSLYKNQMRQAANAEGIQVVHVEILRYLSISNKYSNTAQALTEYLGQTKGSLSQSLKLLETNNYIDRQPSKEDKRVVRVYLTKIGEELLTRISGNFLPIVEGNAQEVSVIKSMLKNWQLTNNHNGFGQCKSCRFNKTLETGTFECALTSETLLISDTNKICREHEFD